MSDCGINIRVWNYHWQVTFNNRWSWSKNWSWKGKALWFNPLVIYDFRPWEINWGKK